MLLSQNEIMKTPFTLYTDPVRWPLHQTCSYPPWLHGQQWDNLKNDLFLKLKNIFTAKNPDSKRGKFSNSEVVLSIWSNTSSSLIRCVRQFNREPQTSIFDALVLVTNKWCFILKYLLREFFLFLNIYFEN